MAKSSFSRPTPILLTAMTMVTAQATGPAAAMGTRTSTSPPVSQPGVPVTLTRKRVIVTVPAANTRTERRSHRNGLRCARQGWAANRHYCIRHRAGPSLFGADSATPRHAVEHLCASLPFRAQRALPIRSSDAAYVVVFANAAAAFRPGISAGLRQGVPEAGLEPVMNGNRTFDPLPQRSVNSAVAS